MHSQSQRLFSAEDTFQAPPLLLFHQPIAENLLRNRLHQLPTYEANAKAAGLEGMQIPVAVGGAGGYSCDASLHHQEVHTAGDTALFVRQAWQATQNVSLLRELFPLLKAACNFAVTRVNRTDAQGFFSIETVIGADEENGVYDDDVFTNAGLVLACESALEAAQLLHLPVDGRWREASERIKIPFFSPSPVNVSGKLHREFAGYRSNRVGQSDTVLLGFPLQFNASHRVWAGNYSQTRLNDLQFYGPRIDPQGSYMSAGHFVIAWLEREHRNLTEAAAWFARGREKNLGPWRIWSEHDWNDGGAANFITAGGMFLQSLLFGYAGVRFTGSGLTHDAVLPPRVTAMKLRGLDGSGGEEFDVVVGAARQQPE